MISVYLLLDPISFIVFTMILNYYFFRQKYSPYSSPHISFSILMADSERNT